MHELTRAAIGGADLAFSAVAAALEGSAKAAGLTRTSSLDSKRIELIVELYEKDGVWVFLAEPSSATKDLARMLAIPLAKALARTLTVYVVSATDQPSTSYFAMKVNAAGKVDPFQSEVGDAHQPEEKPIDERTDHFVRLLAGLTELSPTQRQRRIYYHRPTTGNARLDRFIAAAQTAEKIEIQHEAEGKVVVRLLLPGGVKQMSYFTEAELETMKGQVPALKEG